MSTFQDWYSASDAALRRSMFGSRLHLAAITPADDEEFLRLAYKPNEHAPWAIEYFVRPWRGRSPEPSDVDSITRYIDSDAEKWFAEKPRRSTRKRW